MNGKYRTVALAALLALSAITGRAAAQDDPGYRPDLRPGIRVHSGDEGRSRLQQAIRDRVSLVIDGEEGRIQAEPRSARTHTVRAGDTLWDICARHFGDPYAWPMVWSYNPEITNPHWIYPGDVLWLVSPEDLPPAAAPAAAPSAPPRLVTAARRHADTVLVRNRGFVDEEVLRRSGTIVGSHKEVMMLSQFDEAYTSFPEETEVRVGDEFSAFEILRPVDSVEDPGTEVGKLVEILGVVRVTSFDRETRIARVTIDESLKPIERGTMIGPVHRRFELVPPVANERELEGRIIAFLDPIILAGAHHIVFVDKGREDGVREGNRFLVIEQRDRYRESLGLPDDEEGYPFEVLAELRVIEARPHTSTCLVTASTLELEVGNLVDMVRGY